MISIVGKKLFEKFKQFKQLKKVKKKKKIGVDNG